MERESGLERVMELPGASVRDERDLVPIVDGSAAALCQLRAHATGELGGAQHAQHAVRPAGRATPGLSCTVSRQHVSACAGDSSAGLWSPVRLSWTTTRGARSQGLSLCEFCLLHPVLVPVHERQGAPDLVASATHQLSPNRRLVPLAAFPNIIIIIRGPVRRTHGTVVRCPGRHHWWLQRSPKLGPAHLTKHTLQPAYTVLLKPPRRACELAVTGDSNCLNTTQCGHVRLCLRWAVRCVTRVESMLNTPCG